MALYLLLQYPSRIPSMKSSSGSLQVDTVGSPHSPHCSLLTQSGPLISLLAAAQYIYCITIYKDMARYLWLNEKSASHLLVTMDSENG